MMTRKTSFLTVLIALLVLVVGSSMAQNVRLSENPDDRADISTPGDPGGDDDNILRVQLFDVGVTQPFDIVPSAFGGPFYVGAILVDPDTGEQIGLFHCWGFFFGGETNQRMVTQEFEIFGRGKIILAGREGPGGGSPRAIVGGTGDFRNVRGQATLPGGGMVIFEFDDDVDDDDDDDDD